ncbi:MAG: prephenate dehydratase [bacterium]
MNKKESIVYYQGTNGAYSELAAKIFFGSSVKTQGLMRFEDIFLRFPESPENYGILPIENSLMGSIHKNYDLLLNNNVWIIGEVELRITYNFFVLEKKSSIKEIWAHPSVLEQCREFIAQNQNYHFVPWFDSAGAADIVKKDNRADIGIIAGPQVGDIYGLQCIASNVEDNPNNFTRFLILAIREKIYEGNNAKTSIVFGLKNQPGVLFRCLSIFALRNIDLLKLESRPVIGKPWEYIFYIDLRGSIKDINCKNAIETLKEVSIFFKFLGSYPLIKEYDYGFNCEKLQKG